MNWNEGWRKAKRPHPSEIPEQYALWPAGTDRLIVVYFAAVVLGIPGIPGEFLNSVPGIPYL